MTVQSKNQGGQIAKPDGKSALAKTTILMSFVSALMVFLNALSGFYVARNLIPYEYGRLTYFTSLFLIVSLVFGFGLTVSAIQHLSRFNIVKNYSELNRMFYSLFLMRLSVLLPLLLLSGCLSLITGDDLYFLVGLAASLSVVADFLCGVFQGLQQIWRTALLYLLQPIAFIVLLVAGLNQSSKSVILALELSFGLACVLGILLLWGTGIARPLLKFFSLPHIKVALPISGQSYTISLFQTLYYTYALVWLGSLNQYGEAALLNIAWTLVRILPLGLTPLLNTVLFPRLRSLVTSIDDLNDRKKAASNLVAIYFKGVVVLGLSVSALMAFFPEIVIEFFYTSKYLAAAPILVILAPTVLFLGLEPLLTVTLIALEKTMLPIMANLLRLLLVGVIGLGGYMLGALDLNLLLALAYLLSAFAGTALLAFYYFRLSGTFHAGLLFGFAASSMGIAATCRLLLPEISGDFIVRLYRPAVGGLLMAGIALVFLKKDFKFNFFRIKSAKKIGALALLGLLPLTFIAAPTQSTALAQSDLNCSGAAQSPRILKLDCLSESSTAHFLITMYSRTDLLSNVSWEKQLNYEDSIWLIRVANDERVKLALDFHREGKAQYADLYDDGDGDGNVRYDLYAGSPRILENQGRWTVRVTAQEGWWKPNGKLNFNLDILVDGSLRGSYGSGFIYDYKKLLKNDGQLDFEIHVRDPNNSGFPKYEWRQDRSPLPEDPTVSGQYRTEINANFEGNEAPISGALFWPYLSQIVGNYIKGYNVSASPIQVDWEKGKIVQISEFVASRGKPGNFFVYSLNRIKEGQLNSTNFENPFAFYDLSGVKDGWPDTAIRFEAALPFQLPGDLSIPKPINILEYAWGKEHNHNLTYQVSLCGTKPIDQIISFPEFTIKAVPPQKLPGWVTGQNWDAATFVEVEKQPYWTSEIIYEWTVEQADSKGREKVLPWRYITGLENTPPADAFSHIQAGFRGEYSLNLQAKPYLYFSPVDHKLHLLKADGGVWNLDGQSEISYTDLDHDGYIDMWRYSSPASSDSLTPEIRQLNLAGDYLVYQDGSQVLLRKARVNAFSFVTLPPTNQTEWENLGKKLKEQQASFQPTDFKAMLNQFEGQDILFSHASFSDFRSLKNGSFRFILELREAFHSQEKALPGITDLKPGKYVVEDLDGALRITPSTPPALRVTLSTQPKRYLEQNEVLIAINNDGEEDISEGQLELWVSRSQEELRLVSSQTISLPANSKISLPFIWTPSSAGLWLLTPKLRYKNEELISHVSEQITVLPEKGASSDNIAQILWADTNLLFVLLCLGAIATLGGLVFWKHWQTSGQAHDAE
ncbi:MAG: oligosaccharide flippase family protein [Chloroflexi bacterium]|uniref:Oligosaccharide flippase family protein n=1 Tax=Candidatus Chlorohelix allophototropha TaxID=3003348 RepID=A0A8T7LXS0_9CHLR|nr:oligosaccharide flippase family protein [Chloroflexota bacterium]WJW67556.1 oligosaccharide flippase family protein [Chloroflexota bacterium L227-S17]